MAHKPKRTIKEVLDCRDGSPIDADDFFKKPIDEISRYRSELDKAMKEFREPLFKCYYCRQKIRIRGGIFKQTQRKADIFHFAHYKDSDDCPIKTNNKLSREEVDRIKYNGVKEGKLHQALKEQIAEGLRRNEESIGDVSSIEIERTIVDKVAKEWRKPDINVYFKSMRLAIDLQISTTWLGVITERQHFYKEHGIFILWVFDSFSINDDTRLLTYDDVIYTNKQNAYVFNNETYEMSKLENDLVLKCFYKVYIREEDEIREDWEFAYIKLNDITFDKNEFKIYYRDTERQKEILENEIQEDIDARIEARRVEEWEWEMKFEAQRELNRLIRNLKEDIANVNTWINENENQKYKLNSRLSTMKEFLLGVDKYIEKTIGYISIGRITAKPFSGHDEILKELCDEFGNDVPLTSGIIKSKMEEQSDLTEILIELNQYATIEIGGKSYKNIDPNKSWVFIKKNHSKILTIKKQFIEGFFPEEMMTPVIESSLNQLKNSKDILFLIDLFPKIKVLTEKKQENEEVVEKEKNKISIIKESMKGKLVRYIEGVISTIDISFKELETTRSNLNSQLEEKRLN